MKTKKLTKRAYNLLQTLETALKKAGISIYFDFSQKSAQTDLITARFFNIGDLDSTILGHFTFLPESEFEPGLMYFSCTFSLMDPFTVEQFSLMSRAVNNANLTLPEGQFILTSKDRILSYHHTISFFDTESDAAILDSIIYHIAIGLNLSTLWLDAFKLLSLGRITLDDFKSFM